MKKTFYLPFAFLALASSVAQAQPHPKDWNFSIGPGFVFKKNHRVGNTYKHGDKSFTVRFIPYVQGRYSRLSLGPNGLGINLLGNFQRNIGLSLDYSGDRYDGVGMKKRHQSLFAGINANYNSFQFNFSRDLSDKSDGHFAKISYNKRLLATENFMLIGSLGVNWYDSNYANYYYGVKKNEETASRKAYRAQHYFEPTIGLLPIYKLSSHFSFTMGAFFKHIPSELNNSPTVKQHDVEISGIFGFSYNL